jgi:hypothetical protein
MRLHVAVLHSTVWLSKQRLHIFWIYIATLHSKNLNSTSFTSLPKHKFAQSSCYYYWFRKSEWRQWAGLAWQKHIRCFVQKKVDLVDMIKGIIAWPPQLTLYSDVQAMHVSLNQYTMHTASGSSSHLKRTSAPNNGTRKPNMNTMCRVIVSRCQDRPLQPRHATQCSAALKDPALTTPNTAASCNTQVLILHWLNRILGSKCHKIRSSLLRDGVHDITKFNWHAA